MVKKLRPIRKAIATNHKRRLRKIKKISKQPFFAVPALTFLVLATITVGIFLFMNDGSPKLRPSDTDVVVLNYDKQERTVPTRAKTVGELLDKLQIKLHEGDRVEPSADTEIIGDNFRVNVYRAVPVTIVDGNKKTFVYSAAATPRSIVKQSNVTVYPEDKLELLPTENFLTESSIGERVVIKRATPVFMNLYGTNIEMRTHAKTVGDLLKERNVKLGQDDTVQPAANTPLTPKSQVFVVRKGTQIVVEEQAIPAPVEEVEDNSLTFGTRVVRQQGAPGKKLITFQVEMQNGQEVGRKVIQEVVAVEPVKQVVARGKHFDISGDKTAVMAAAGISPSDYMYVDYIVSRESRWNPTARNPRSGAYGLCQAVPATKMSSAGSDWESNPVTQLKWCHGYAKGRYGSWAEAYRVWQAQHWW